MARPLSPLNFDSIRPPDPPHWEAIQALNAGVLLIVEEAETRYRLDLNRDPDGHNATHNRLAFDTELSPRPPLSDWSEEETGREEAHNALWGDIRITYRTPKPPLTLQAHGLDLLVSRLQALEGETLAEFRRRGWGSEIVRKHKRGTASVSESPEPPRKRSPYDLGVEGEITALLGKLR